MGNLFDLFYKGMAVANPTLWKNRQITVNMLGGSLVALLNLLHIVGVEIPIDEAGANAVAACVLVLVNCVLTITTSTKVGMQPKQEPLQYPPLDK
jgi:uncharacterized membrane protein